ncbi:MAG: hypothetical protein OXI38_03420 [Bacteroidota bacterium]|nr:hypothetical protein [Bacteroidota bacterium]
MELRLLMSGIAIVLDDAFDPDPVDRSLNDHDLIHEIVRLIEQEWSTPFFKTHRIPAESMWSNLFKSASFILLDWRLWPKGAATLEEHGIRENLKFIRAAIDYSVPVLIFTNEDPTDIEGHLNTLFPDESTHGFVFVERKNELLNNGTLVLTAISTWVAENLSVYTLKTWDSLLQQARIGLFRDMYSKNPNWPAVFWQTYLQDGVDASSALTDMINDCLTGRISADAFESTIFTSKSAATSVSLEDFHALLSATCFLVNVSENEVRCGDVFKSTRGRYLLNIRPDCDCIPRDDNSLDNIELYVLEGKKTKPLKLYNRVQRAHGHILERIYEAIVFAAGDEGSIVFDFRRLRIRSYSELRSRRIGRLLQPYMTRIQQRYALFMQRQGLPRIPDQT